VADGAVAANRSQADSDPHGEPNAGLQRDLDSLRGIHATINALYSLFPDMKEREADRLFYKLLEEVERNRPIHCASLGMARSRRYSGTWSPMP
jgi:hypothetical protein